MRTWQQKWRYNKVLIPFLNHTLSTEKELGWIVVMIIMLMTVTMTMNMITMMVIIMMIMILMIKIMIIGIMFITITINIDTMMTITGKNKPLIVQEMSFSYVQKPVV